MTNIKKGLQNFVANHNNSSQPQKILTSKQAIQLEKEKEKNIKKNEDLELGNMQKMNYHKKSDVLI